MSNTICFDSVNNFTRDQLNKIVLLDGMFSDKVIEKLRMALRKIMIDDGMTKTCGDTVKFLLLKEVKDIPCDVVLNWLSMFCDIYYRSIRGRDGGWILKSAARHSFRELLAMAKFRLSVLEASDKEELRNLQKTKLQLEIKALDKEIKNPESRKCEVPKNKKTHFNGWMEPDYDDVSKLWSLYSTPPG